MPVWLLCFTVSLYSFQIEKEKEFVASITELSIKQEYKKGLKLVYNRINQNSSSFVPYFYGSTLLEAKMIDYEKNSDEKLFNTWMQKADSLLEMEYPKGSIPEDWYYYYRGSIKTTRGVHALRFKEYLEAIALVRQGLKDLEKTVTLNPEHYDAYFYLGLYEYGKSEIFGMFDWVLFFRDKDSLSGLGRLRLCMDSSYFSKEVARQAMIGILTREKKFTQAESLALLYLKKYPESRSVHWLLADQYEKSKQNEKALQIYKKLSPIQKAELS